MEGMALPPIPWPCRSDASLLVECRTCWCHPVPRCAPLPASSPAPPVAPDVLRSRRSSSGPWGSSWVAAATSLWVSWVREWHGEADEVDFAMNLGPLHPLPQAPSLPCCRHLLSLEDNCFNWVERSEGQETVTRCHVGLEREKGDLPIALSIDGVASCRVQTREA
uniref:Uncharacterized protein n=1 Tax=Arundo donax TaxID=35708 RepID=A0A0A8XRZ9_ARUDO